jgi:hypothetical protein
LTKVATKSQSICTEQYVIMNDQKQETHTSVK